MVDDNRTAWDEVLAEVITTAFQQTAVIQCSTCYHTKIRWSLLNIHQGQKI